MDHSSMPDMHTTDNDTAVSASADISQYIKGIFVRDTSGDMVNVVNRDDNIDTLQKNQIRMDINGDKAEDIMMWDTTQVWIKYAHPEKEEKGTTFTRLYRSPVFDSPADVSEAVDKG